MVNENKVTLRNTEIYWEQRNFTEKSKDILRKLKYTEKNKVLQITKFY